MCNLPEDRPTENDLGELFEKYGSAAHPVASKLRTFSESSSSNSTSCPRPITASFSPDGSSSKLPRADLVSSQDERQERVVKMEKMPTKGPAVGISK